MSSCGLIGLAGIVSEKSVLDSSNVIVQFPFISLAHFFIILKAKKKPVEEISLESLGIDIAPRLKIEKVEAPTERAGGVIVKSVDELLEKLRNEAKVF